MSRWIARQPQSVTIDGTEYALNTNFDNCMQTVAAIDDRLLADWEKADIILNNMYSEPRPANVSAAVELAIAYLRENREPKERDKPPLLDFEQDKQLIIDAFMRKGIDLRECDMTYWSFMSHLRELPNECMLCRIVHLRQQIRRGKLSKEEKRDIQSIGEDVVYLKNRDWYDYE